MIKRIKKNFADVILHIPFSFIKYVAMAIVAVLCIMISVSLIARYFTMNQGIQSFYDGDYDNSIFNFKSEQGLFAIDEWKQDFNAGVSYFASGQQIESIESFNLAREKALHDQDKTVLCEIDTNISFSYEKLGETILKSKTDNNLDALRDKSNYYLQAYLKRLGISQDCNFMSADFIRTSNNLLEADKDSYGKIQLEIHQRGGTTAELNGSSQVSDDKEFLEHAKEFNEEMNSDKLSDPKLQQLMDDYAKSQAEYNNGQDYKNKQDKQVDKPW